MNWAVIVGVTLLVMISLLGIVVRAGRLIAEQQATLTRHVDEVHKISNQNHELRRRAELASRRLSELNASYLRSVGAELHDGPAQLISLAALKVEQARRAKTALTRLAELRNIHAVLTDALRDIRTISKGLMLPEIEHLPLAEVVRRAIRVHEARTKTTVDLRCGNLDCNVSHATKICVYRFLQEGLSNAVRHAGGMGLTVFCKLEGSRLSVAVRDQGAYDNHGCEFEAGLGLTGLRARVESLGGTFTIASTPDGGTQIEMSLDTEVENDEQDFNSDWGRPFAISRGSRSGAATG